MLHSKADVVEDYSKQGMAEDVPEDLKSAPGREIYHLPHHAVLKEDKATTKLHVELGNSLKKSLKPDRSQLRLWTDSMIALHWICSSAQRWKQFV